MYNAHVFTAHNTRRPYGIARAVHHKYEYDRCIRMSIPSFWPNELYTWQGLVCHCNVDGRVRGMPFVVCMTLPLIYFQ